MPPTENNPVPEFQSRSEGKLLPWSVGIALLIGVLLLLAPWPVTAVPLNLVPPRYARKSLPPLVAPAQGHAGPSVTGPAKGSADSIAAGKHQGEGYVAVIVAVDAQGRMIPLRKGSGSNLFASERPRAIKVWQPAPPGKNGVGPPSTSPVVHLYRQAEPQPVK